MNQWIVFRKLSESLLFSGNLYTSFFHSVTFWSPKWRSFKIPLKVGHEWNTQTSHAWITWLWKTFHQQPTSSDGDFHLQELSEFRGVDGQLASGLCVFGGVFFVVVGLLRSFPIWYHWESFCRPLVQCSWTEKKTWKKVGDLFQNFQGEPLF